MAGEKFTYEYLYNNYVAKFEQAQTPEQRNDIIVQLILKIEQRNAEYQKEKAAAIEKQKAREARKQEGEAVDG